MADGTILAGLPPQEHKASEVRTGSLRRFARRRSTIAFLMCLPLLVVVFTLVIYPAGYAIYLSMLNKKMTKFVGLSNYTFLLSRPTFQMVIFQSVIFAVSAVFLKAIVGFILAHLMQNVPSNRQRLWPRLTARAVGDPAGDVDARLVVVVRPVPIPHSTGSSRASAGRRSRGSAPPGGPASRSSSSMSGMARRSS